MDDKVSTNTNVFSIARLYNDVLSSRAYNGMSYAQREKALLSHCLVSDEDIALQDLNISNDKINEQSIKYSVYSKDNRVFDDCIIIENTEVPIVFQFDAPTNNAIYLELYNIRTENADEKDDINITAKCGDIKKRRLLLSRSNIYYWGNHNLLFNMDYTNQNRDMIELYFDKEGKYFFDEINVECQSYKEFLNSMANLKRDNIEDIKIQETAIVASFENNSDKIIYYSIPYSEGWKLYIDDCEVPIFCANNMGIGAKILPGKHVAELKYNPPYYRVGLLLSGIGVFLLIVLIITIRMVKKDYKNVN